MTVKCPVRSTNLDACPWIPRLTLTTVELLQDYCSFVKKKKVRRTNLDAISHRGCFIVTDSLPLSPAQNLLDEMIVSPPSCCPCKSLGGGGG